MVNESGSLKFDQRVPGEAPSLENLDSDASGRRASLAAINFSICSAAEGLYDDVAGDPQSTVLPGSSTCRAHESVVGLLVAATPALSRVRQSRRTPDGG
jgi:hypothetical protein